MDANYKPYKRYDDEFKCNAVELLEASGRSISEVSGDLCIPYKFLERWRYKYRPRDGGLLIWWGNDGFNSIEFIRIKPQTAFHHPGRARLDATFVVRRP